MNLVFGQFDLLLNGASASQERFSGLGQLDLATGPVEQLCPEPASSDWMCWLSGGCEMFSRRAATVKLRSSATAMKYRSWRRSIAITY